jgi:hypothetical protein
VLARASLESRGLIDRSICVSFVAEFCECKEQGRIAEMRHEVAASNGALEPPGTGHGAVPEVDFEKMPLLSPLQLGRFKLSHRYAKA